MQSALSSAIVLLKTGCTNSGASSNSGSKVNLRSCKCLCGIVSRGDSTFSASKNKISISKVRGAHFSFPSRLIKILFVLYDAEFQALYLVFEFAIPDYKIRVDVSGPKVPFHKYVID